MNEDAIRCIGRTARGPVSADATQLESGTPLESPADGCRVCRICWVSLERDDPDVVSPCRCKGSMEYIHTDCLKAWQDQLCRMKGKNPLYCDVCHQAYTVNTRLLQHRVRRIVMSMTHSRIAPLVAIIFRAAQHYVVSLSLMNGLETALTSMASSASSWRRGLSGEHCTNVLKAITGISVINIVVSRTLNGVLDLVCAPFKAIKRFYEGFVTSWPRRLVIVGAGSEQKRNLPVSGEQMPRMSRVCKRCKQRYIPDENSPNACSYHPLNWSGGEKAKAVGFLRKSSAPEDSLSQTLGTGMLSFWDCCGADDYNAPGCTRGYHIPFGEETSDDVYH
ncbi:hypothetical protein M9434_002755 [Picochlorum sp. BPE23]|nr:hypothetical protein M9434_002755 [Picochlorum sp. BPE23]